MACARACVERIDPTALGLRVEPVRQLALAASRGSTDFGGLFIGLSLFLIVSAIMLVTLVFRLGIERRAHEIGVMLATGFTTRTLFRLLLAEGIVLSTIGPLFGLLGAVGYAWLLLAGLRPVGSGAGVASRVAETSAPPGRKRGLGGTAATQIPSRGPLPGDLLVGIERLPQMLAFGVLVDELIIHPTIAVAGDFPGRILHRLDDVGIPLQRHSDAKYRHRQIARREQSVQAPKAGAGAILTQRLPIHRALTF